MLRFFPARRVLLAALVASALSASALAAEPLYQGGKGYFMIGWAGVDLGDLNGALRTHGYPSFDEDLLSLGGGGHAVLGRLVIGGHGHGFIAGDEDANIGGTNYHMQLQSGAGFFDLGVVAYPGRTFSLTPMVGLGGGGMTLELLQRAAPTFDEVLVDPGRSTRLSSSAFLVDLGVQADMQIVTRRMGPRRGGPVFGIRAGYVLAPFIGDWHLDDNGISGGPEVGLTGPYVTLLLGAGGHHDTYGPD